jgi:hypothetical protein
VNGIKVDVVGQSLSLASHKGLHHLDFSSAAAVVQRSVSVAICQIMIHLFLQSCHEGLFSPIDSSQMQQILSL